MTPDYSFSLNTDDPSVQIPSITVRINAETFGCLMGFAHGTLRLQAVPIQQEAPAEAPAEPTE